MQYIDKERVVGQAWFAVKNEESWKEVVNYCDLGMPLAYAAQSGLVGELGDSAKGFIEEAYGILLESVELPADSEFASWADLNKAAIEQNGQ
ncbi:MAG: hypothetical protein KDC39_11920 [Actinobacteria bacterium]|nr:hypothetical protein [Actinomycetota bacterium]